jgi:TRAP-type uncharacterized transport system substrate-binding protein
LRIGSSSWGTFYTQGEALAELLNRERLAGEVRMVETSLVSVDNTNRLDGGEIE